ncbi:MAG: DUF192 domain-containing protein [Patescibacteria group bacterium]
MRPSQTIFLAAVVISIGVLFYLADYGISTQALPSFREYIASTTPETASTTLFAEYSASATSSPVLLSEDEKQGLLPLYAPTGLIYTHVAKTPSTRALGLSGYAPLASDEGMLFMFPQPGAHSFWMKDMNFSIDIIWISSDKRIIGVLEGISPETYPETFLPPEPAQFVLEVTAGGAKKFGIKEGSTVAF